MSQVHQLFIDLKREVWYNILIEFGLGHTYETNLMKVCLSETDS